jgi:hypothetical protein
MRKSCSVASRQRVQKKSVLTLHIPITLTPTIRRFVVDITHEVREIRLSQLLPDRRVLAGVIPVVVRVSQQERSEGVVCRLTVARAV